MDNKKAVAAAIAAVISASGAAIDATFDNPADILQDTSIQPKVAYADPTISPDDDSMQDEKKEAQTVKGTFRGWILSLPIGVRALFIVPQWFIGNVIVAGGQLLFAGLSPLFNAILTFAIMAAVIIGAFTVTAKAMFPDLPLSKILNKHTLKGLLAATAGAFATDQVLGVCWTDYAQFKMFVIAGVTLLAIGSVVTWFARREHRRRAKLEAEAAAAAEKARAEEPEELIVRTMGETFKIRLQKEFPQETE